ncbi:peptidyl-prolyl cis-trans isomerase, cyclophilin-type family protein [Reticulomyxa filosa]|uniref:Peptidyl-prolyl cis-trans isomerase n=1 Tax=Reticulomyxa filosa TaxID=46433 RepID=X6M5W7_RETFI|nr:peptidyl-prolyl cis-trans isomerase, cyclophilin-type family protein [Reticulomyxa filosa]|eukprot:ETO09036.1 peptidyl-prolyl cis-trans isomerase, cyclophilin-type family protein [Reticulomyxa filosa]
MSVIIETSLGTLVLDLFVDEAPKACENFLKLCKIKYYNDCLFHNIQKDFIIQTGDPTGTGKGGTSIWGLLDPTNPLNRYFKSEISPTLKHKHIGIVSMASLRDNNSQQLNKASSTSQFFITTSQEHLQRLDGKYGIFGQVEEGLDVLQKINSVYVDETTGRPLTNIRIRHTIIIGDPFPDPEGLEQLIPERSPTPKIDRFDFERIKEEHGLKKERKEQTEKIQSTAEEETGSKHTNDKEETNLDDSAKSEENKQHKEKKEGEENEEDEDSQILLKLHETEEELREELARENAKSDAIVLELLGDIPESDIKPPDNVLFVCKLNPYTKDEHLQLIFSRFGSIVDCEIIRDWKTGDSLCYAFITFESTKDCERAYVEGNNMLIDDRRIKVDFSQSVSKYWSHYHKGGKFSTQNASMRVLEANMRGKDRKPFKHNARDTQRPKHETKLDGRNPSEPDSLWKGKRMDLTFEEVGHDPIVEQLLHKDTSESKRHSSIRDSSHTQSKKISENHSTKTSNEDTDSIKVEVEAEAEAEVVGAAIEEREVEIKAGLKGNKKNEKALSTFNKTMGMRLYQFEKDNTDHSLKENNKILYNHKKNCNTYYWFILCYALIENKIAKHQKIELL